MSLPGTLVFLLPKTLPMAAKRKQGWCMGRDSVGINSAETSIGKLLSIYSLRENESKQKGLNQVAGLRIGATLRCCHQHD